MKKIVKSIVSLFKVSLLLFTAFACFRWAIVALIFLPLTLPICIYIKGVSIKSSVISEESIKAMAFMFSIFFALSVFLSASKLTDTICHSLMKGRTLSEKGYMTNSDGDEIETTYYTFVPRYDSDKTEASVIEWSIFILVFAIPIINYLLLKVFEQRESDRIYKEINS